jgi:hypothetical protein
MSQRVLGQVKQQLRVAISHDQRLNHGARAQLGFEPRSRKVLLIELTSAFAIPLEIIEAREKKSRDGRHVGREQEVGPPQVEQGMPVPGGFGGEHVEPRPGDQAFAWIGDQVPYEARQSVLARVMSGSLIGVICGQLIGGICVDTVGWRWAFVVLAALFGIVAIMMRASPAARLRPAPAMAAGDTGLRAVLRNYASIARPTWSMMILGAVMIEALIMYGGLSFIPTTLHDRFGIPLWQAAMISAVMGVGGFVYTLLAARLIGRLGEQRLVVVGGTMVCAGLMLVAVAPYPWLAAVGTGALAAASPPPQFAGLISPSFFSPTTPAAGLGGRGGSHGSHGCLRRSQPTRKLRAPPHEL